MLRALRINLRARGYEVTTASRRAARPWPRPAGDPPDAVLLDLGLPDLDGVEVIRELRGWSRAPVIVLSGRAGSGDKIGALDAGADDYVTKPFDMEELLARLRAALRRDDRAPGAARFAHRPPRIDLGAHTIVATAGTAQPEPLHLTPTEWRLLEILLGAPGQLVGCRSAAHRGVGTRVRAAAPTTCGSTWPGCAASWRTTRTARATC